jgi:molecular chaperone GrpE
MEDEHNDPAEEASEAAGPAAATESAEETAEELKQQRDDYYDRLLRKTAEFDNYRRRTDRERQQLSDAAAADLLEELLPLVDDLERALRADAGGDATGAVRKGVELIHKQLLEILRKRGVRPIEALGADFDPHFHMAVAHEPVNDRREGEVVEEFRRGYMLGDRLLRPAMVKVAKA